MIKKLTPFIKKEFIEIIRDKLSLASLLFLPVILLFIYGYAISLDVKEIRVSIYDGDRSELSREFVDNLTASGYFKTLSFRDSPKGVELDVQNSTAQIGIIIYPSFEKDSLKNNLLSLQIIVDGSNAQKSQYTLNYLNAALESFSRKEIKRHLIIRGITGEDQLIGLNYRILYNPLLKSSLYLIPGLIAFVIMISGAISTTVSIVREKENKTTEQLILCPISPSLLILGKIIPYFIIATISSTVMISLSILFFDLPFRGSIIFLSYSVLLFLLCALGFGIFVSTISSSQQVAFTIAAFTTLLPTIILSGFIFPISNMPEVIQYITYVVPARYFIGILRGILLKGSGPLDLLPETASLTLYVLIITSLSIVRIKKKGIL